MGRGSTLWDHGWEINRTDERHECSGSGNINTAIKEILYYGLSLLIHLAILITSQALNILCAWTLSPDIMLREVLGFSRHPVEGEQHGSAHSQVLLSHPSGLLCSLCPPFSRKEAWKSEPVLGWGCTVLSGICSQGTFLPFFWGPSYF